MKLPTEHQTVIHAQRVRTLEGSFSAHVEVSDTMNTFLLNLVLASLLLVAIRAAPEPKPARGRGGAYYNEPANPKYRSAGEVDKGEQFIAELRQAAETDGDLEEDDDEDVSENTPGKADASSGRLFQRLLFRIFGSSSSNTQPVIPIIITGAGGSAGTTNPTSTITSTGTIPTASGTITTTPLRRSSDEYNKNEEESEPAAMIDEQALKEVLAAGGQEYVVTDEAIKGTSENKPTQAPNRINLRRNGVRKGQVISVRIPPKYRRYFQRGQRVMLNASTQPVKRRVIKKRVNKNNSQRRVNRNRNKTRFVTV